MDFLGPSATVGDYFVIIFVVALLVGGIILGRKGGGPKGGK